MKRFKRCKPPKQAPPEETIARIKALLAEAEIETIEKSYENGPFFSALIEMRGQDLPSRLAAAGKGMTRGYASAGALAEFMERLQNHVLVHPAHHYAMTRPFLEGAADSAEFKTSLTRKTPVLDFYWDPREILLTAEETVEYCYGSLARLLEMDDKNALLGMLKDDLKLQKILCVPFSEPKTGREEWIPVRFLELRCDSNGMCAGNTPEEAMVQGICEIFERHALKRIFYEQPPLPEIPRACFQGSEIHDRMGLLEKDLGWRIGIRDCSLGIGVPVVGIVVMDQKCRWGFHVGAATSPLTALERCFTELFQMGFENRLIWINPLEDGLESAKKNGDRSGIDRYLLAYLRKGPVAFPHSVLDSPRTCHFSGFPYAEGNSQREDLQQLIERIYEMGYRLLVRDAAFLGFPAYFLYVPGLSESSHIDREEFVGWFRLNHHHLPTLNNLANSDRGRLKDLAKTLSGFCGVGEKGRKSLGVLFFAEDDSLRRFSPFHLQILIALKLGELEKAAFLLDQLLADSRNGEAEKNSQHRCLRDALKHSLKGMSEAEIASDLGNAYPAPVVEKAMEWITDPEAAFRRLRLPVCFDCDRCPYQATCRFLSAMAWVRKLKANGKWNKPLGRS